MVHAILFTRCWFFCVCFPLHGICMVNIMFSLFKICHICMSQQNSIGVRLARKCTLPFFRLATSTWINIWQLIFQNLCINDLKIKALIKHRNLQSSKRSVSYLLDQYYSYYINDFYIISKNHILAVKFVVL